MRAPFVRFGFAILVSGLIAGCATGPKYSEIASSIPALAPGMGRIYFYRNSALGAAIQPDIRLNGVPVGTSKANGFFFVDREPGQYTVAMTTEVETTTSFTLSAGQTRYVRTYMSMGFLVGHAEAELVEPETARVAIADLSYTGDSVSPGSVSAGGSKTPSGVAGAETSEQAGEAKSDPRVGIDDLKGMLPDSGK